MTLTDRQRDALEYLFAAIVALAALAFFALRASRGAGVPPPKPPPDKLGFADLSGLCWKARYGRLEGMIALRADQTYDAYLDVDGGRCHYRGTWSVLDGVLTLLETSDGDSWDRHDCRLKAAPRWRERGGRAATGFMSRQPVVPAGPASPLEVGWALWSPAAVPPDVPGAEAIRRWPGPGAP